MQFVLMFALLGVLPSFDWRADVESGNFSSESHPNNDEVIRKQDGKVTYIQHGSWVAFKKFDFGDSSTYMWVECAAENAGAAIELRLGSATGTVVGTINVPSTGGWESFKPVGLKFSRPLTGVNDLYLKFVGQSGYLCNIRKFRFQRLTPDYVSPTLVPDAAERILPGTFTQAGKFDIESDPQDENKVRADGGNISYITSGTWAAFKDFDFGNQAKYFSIEAASESSATKLELHLGKIDGPLIGTVNISSTGSFKTFKTFDVNLSRPVTGKHDLYFKFIGPGGYIFDLGAFQFLSITPGTKAPGSMIQGIKFDRESHPKTEPVIIEKDELKSLKHSSWISYTGFNFGQKTEVITLYAAAEKNGGIVELRLDSVDGPLIGTVNITHTGSWTHYRPFTTVLSTPANGRHDLFLKFMSRDATTKDNLFNLSGFIFGNKPVPPIDSTEGALNVYPPVPGLDPSPYYTFSIQKLSELNNPKKEQATNWRKPFAWFTRCVDQQPDKKVAYFEEFIGGWSHTYCNFELGRKTPIVVKITRLNKPGAPSGPITMANAHPAHKVKSCEIINGDVYVTMDQPALVAIDIDGQLDTRDAPRAVPDSWMPGTFPYSNEMNGAHGVTIFANPVMPDKPDLTDPNVFAVKPGTLPPKDGPWKVLYFLPGIHKLSVDEQGHEREWKTTDPLYLQNDKHYYIPGDAIVYGNLNDYRDDKPSQNIRVFGHGTISGTKIPHWKDFSFGELPGEDQNLLKMLFLTRASNCSYEGITVADPAEHGIYIEGHGVQHPNRISWVKNIAWRVNNDGGGVTGNGYIEDCFFRHQDDALYVRGMAIRRCVMWSDVNGTPFRCSFITNDRGAGYSPILPPDLVVEDCDIIYTRGVFASSNSQDFGVIGTPGAFDTTRTYADGTLNTAQHLLFRNIRVTDPRPVRYLLGFHANGDVNDAQKTPWAGLRFENVEYRHPQTWAWKSRLVGTDSAPIRNWYFDNVSINGQFLDAKLLADPKSFETQNVSNMSFNNSKPTGQKPSTKK